MINIKYNVVCLLLIVLTIGCVRSTLNGEEIKQELSVHLRASDRSSIETRAGVSDAAIDEQSVYILVFEGNENGSRLLDYSKAKQKSDGSYTAPLKKQSEACCVYIVANAASEVAALAPTWSHLTTLQEVRQSLKTEPLPQIGNVISKMPSKHPMCTMQALPNGISESTLIGTPSTPIELTRATAKLVVAYAGTGTHFSLTGANLGSATVKSFILPDVLGASGAEEISTAHYGPLGDMWQMMAGINPAINTETTPLYAYESLKENETFIIIKGSFNGIEGYYRIDMRLPDNKSEYLPLLRNYYYRITITRVYKAGYASIMSAIDNPAENGIQATIEVVDADSHEIISNGVDHLGLTNSEYRIYDSYVLSEFDSKPYGSGNERTHYDLINGYKATTINYRSHILGSVTCVECTTVSGGTQTTGIQFRDTKTDIWAQVTGPDDNSWGNVKAALELPVSTESVTRKEIIIIIPHDLIRGKIKIKLGTLEKEILIEKHNTASYMGELYDMGTGFSMAKIGFEKTYTPTEYYGFPPSFVPKPAISATEYSNIDFVRFSTSASGSYTKTLTPNPSDNLYVKIDPVSPDENMVLKDFQNFSAVATEFYLTRATTQSRVKIHLTREPYIDIVRDSPPLGPPSWQYVAAFWKNDQTGERIIRAYEHNGSGWSARVVYGQDFIRIANVDDRTQEEIQRTDAENFQIQADDKWSTYIQQPYYSYTHSEARPMPQMAFRIALTSRNTSGKPRYGVVVLISPYARGYPYNGQSIVVMVRQGQDADYIFEPTETYNGAPRIYAQAFSPYGVTVSDTTANPGGVNFADHKSMGGRGVFTTFPTQSGYRYQYGSDIAIHPTNPTVATPIHGYTYNYAAQYKEVCPAGYMTPVTDQAQSGMKHSFLYDLKSGETALRNPLGLCADGFYDRHPRVSYNGSFYQIIQAGVQSAYPGIVRINPITKASIFIPRSTNRDNGLGLLDDGETVFWGRIVAPEDSHKQAVFNVGANKSFATEIKYSKDRKGAFPARCVKIRDFDQSTGGVRPPSDGQYEDWR